MSDVVAAALIAGLSTAAVGIAGTFGTYYGTKRQSQVTVETVERQAEVELQKLEAENERLRAERRDAERSNRQGTYHRWVASVDRLAMIATGYEPVTAFPDWLQDNSLISGGIKLFGAPAVREAFEGYDEAMGALGREMRRFDAGTEEFDTAFRIAYRRHVQALFEAEGRVIEAMRADVTELS